MSRRRAAAVAGLAAALGLVAWLAWPGDSAPPPAEASRSAAPRPRGEVGAPRSGSAAPLEGEPAPEGKGPPHPLTVIDAATGKPLAGVLVQLKLPPETTGRYFHHHPRERLVAQATTDASGVANLRSDAALQSARVAAYKDFYEYGDEPFAEGMTVALEPLPKLRGRVVNERGLPEAGARVSTTRHKLTATSDGEGRFELDAPETEWLYAEKDGALAHGAWVENKHQEVVLTLVGATVPRRVVDTAGQPLDKVSIDFRLGALEVHRETGPDGIWQMAKVDARPDIVFKKAGYATHHETMFDLDGRPKNVMLSRAGRVLGLVVRPDGTPVPGVEIHGFDRMRPWGHREPLRTGADGRFVREDVEFSDLHLTAVLGEEEARFDRTIAEGQTLEVKLVLRPRPVTVALEVVDAAGKEVPGFLWKAVATPAGGAGERFESDLGELELPRGRYRVAVTARGGAKGEAELAVEAADPEPLRVTLDAAVDPQLLAEPGEEGELDGLEEEPPTHSLKVRVTGPTGVPVGNVEVSCLYDQGLTREDGVYECKFTPNENSWPLQVRAAKGSESGMTRAFGKETEVVVVLRSARDIKVRFEGALPQRPCKLTVNSPTEADELEVTGNPMVLPSRSTVRAFLCLECKGELESDGVVRLGCAVAEGGQGEVVVPLGAPGTLTVKVLDSTGLAVEDPIFYIDRQGFDPPAPGGEARVPVVPGTHVLVINVRGKRERAELPFTIRSGETTALGTVQLK